MTVHVLHAGDGYTYLTRQVAAGDDGLARGQDLADYYTAQGNPPGRWLGSGLDDLAVSGQVSESQMRALFGQGAHPNRELLVAEYEQLYVAAGATLAQAHELADRDLQLGRRFPTYDSVRPSWGDLLKRAYSAEADRRGLNTSDLDLATRVAVRDRVSRVGFAADHDRDPRSDHELRSWIAGRARPPRQAVAGYDLVFTPVKSVSVLWALSPGAVRAEVAAAHEAAVQTALAYIELHAAKTRTGTGGLAQIDTRGLVAAAFDHRDSRSGDPNLHTHVAVSTKVQGVDGAWRSLDGRVLFALAVSASEVYTTAVEDELRQRLGVRFTSRRTRRENTRPVREIAGVDPRLLSAFSSRRAAIELAYEDKLRAYREQYGHEPDRSGQARLAQEATLTTRQAKSQPSAFIDQRAGWLSTAAGVVGVPSAAVGARILEQVRRAAEISAPDQPTDDITNLADRVLNRVAQDRSTWNRWHIRAEADRQTRDQPVSDHSARSRLVDDLTREVLARSVSLTAPSLERSRPTDLRREDGESIFTVHGAGLFSSREVLAAESQLLEAGRSNLPPAVTQAHMNQAVAEMHAKTGRTLSPDQIAFANHLATDDRQLALGIGPAGSGKTAALRLLSDAAKSAGVGVIALAPSARSAAVLGEELEVPAETIHKYLHDLDHHPDRDPLRRGDILLVDEAGMAGTMRVDRLARHAGEHGAAIRLVGDPQQLAAVEAGGALRLLATDLPVAQLATLYRFTNEDEASVTLLMRDGDTAAIDFYDDRGRLTGGVLANIVEKMYEAWRVDTQAGLASLMLTTRAGLVAELSVRARLDRIAQGVVDPTATIRLHDDTYASPGDLVVTRRNDRTNVVQRGRDFVKNGDVWRVRAVQTDGGLDLIHLGHGGTAIVTPAYASSEVELAYASTIHRAQGLTVDTTHVLVDLATTRESLYVGVSRGRDSNHLYAVTDELLDVDLDHAPDGPRDARDVVRLALERAGAEKSATQTLRDSLHASDSLARLVPEYEHVYADRVRDRADIPDAVRVVLGMDVANRAMADPAWPTAALALSQAADSGLSIDRVLHDAAARGRLEATASPAQTLLWRVSAATSGTVRRVRRAAGLPVWLSPPPQIPVGHAGHSEVDTWLSERAGVITERVNCLVQGAIQADPAWLGQLHRLRDGRADALLRDVLAYRDQYHVEDETRPLGHQPLRRGAELDRWRQLNGRVTDIEATQADAQSELSPRVSAALRGPRL